jgi:Bacterial transcriptional activator domain
MGGVAKDSLKNPRASIAARSIEFRVLGPLEARVGERALQLGGAKQRAVLAILLLHANEVVSSDRLIDELWGADPPSTAATALQVHVSQLRKALQADRDILQTHAPGYTIALEADQLDLRRFERLAAEGERALADGDPASAAGSLRAALHLWRGPPWRISRTSRSRRFRSSGWRSFGSPSLKHASMPSSPLVTIRSSRPSSTRSSWSIRSGSDCGDS